MREIKFRGKRIDNDEWVYGYFVEDGFYYIGYHNEDNFLTLYVVDDDTIGQYTGLKDNNGTEIYEGDIISINVGGDKFYAEVLWNNDVSAFCIKLSFDDSVGNRPLGDWVETGLVNVVGNLHDNPELLNKH